jgi:hypothetical protein
LVPGTDEHLLASRFTVDSIIEGLIESTTDESTAALDVVASGSIDEERRSSDHPRFMSGSNASRPAPVTIRGRPSESLHRRDATPRSGRSPSTP